MDKNREIIKISAVKFLLDNFHSVRFEVLTAVTLKNAVSAI
jgi:hypothetical protein